MWTGTSATRLGDFFRLEVFTICGANNFECMRKNDGRTCTTKSPTKFTIKFTRQSRMVNSCVVEAAPSEGDMLAGCVGCRLLCDCHH